jgi:hypothetical protein
MNNNTQDGAEQLARRIREYWRSRGAEIHAWVEKGQGGKNHSVWQVRSDLYNGLPRSS